MSSKTTEQISIRVSQKTANALRGAVQRCGRGMSQGLFLGRCFDLAAKHVIANVAKEDVDRALAEYEKGKRKNEGAKP